MTIIGSWIIDLGILANLLGIHYHFRKITFFQYLMVLHDNYDRIALHKINS